MDDARRASWRRQRIDALGAAVVRAVAGDPALRYRGQRLYRDGQPLPVTTLAAHLPAAAEAGDQSAWRGAADGAALRMRHSDLALHRRLQPADPVERALFELLEQLRVESLAPEAMPGLAANLHAHFVHWAEVFHGSRLTEGRVALVVYTLAQMCWSKLNARPVLEDTEEIIEGTRAKLVRRLGGHLSVLRRDRRDQTAWAGPAREIARIVASMVRELVAQQDGEIASDADEALRASFALLLEPGDGEDGAAGAGQGAASALPAAGPAPYRVFTTRYDREQRAAALVRPAQLRAYRDQLDRSIATLGISLARLSRTFAAALLQPRDHGRRFGEEEGRIDGRRLAQVVSSPGEQRVFMLDEQRPRSDCALAFLIDCSGSMKAHGERIALAVDLMVRALERCGVTTEVLGFTTGAWHGGRARLDWQRAGRPPDPGRLNELCHLVFKDAGQRWRRARLGIAALLRDELYREGIDGEAVAWACARLRAHEVERRILVVVSDGCPMDTATAAANDEGYLDRHLQQVVAREEAGGIEIRGIGSGLDLGLYYRHSLPVDLAGRIDHDFFARIARLAGSRPRA